MSASRSPAAPAFAHLNLRRNPFGEVPREERGALVVADLDPLIAQLERPRGVVQLIGESGRGKTSHLLALAERLEAPRYVRIDPHWRGAVPYAPELLVDEVQWLPRRARRRLFARRDTRLVLGTHDDLTTELEAAGLDVLTLHPARELDAERLEAAFARRIAWARRGPGPVPSVPRATVERLIERAGDDVRAMEGLLYEALQRCTRIGEIEL